MARTIEETMAARLKEIDAEEAGEDVSDTVTNEEPEEAPETPDEEPPEQPDEEPEDGARVRDDKGRFVAKKQDSAAQAAADSAPQTALETAKPQPVEPPVSWGAEDKALFSKLPQDVQATLARREKEREADYTRKTQAVSLWTDLDKRYGTHAGAMGMTTVQLADQLFATRAALATGTPAQRVQVLQQIASGFGIDLRALVQPQGPAPQQPGQPADHPAMQAVSQIGQRVEFLQQSLEAQAQAAALTAAQQQIDAFKDAKDKDGTLLHPHFASLENDILTLVRGVRAQGQPVNLQAIYEQAVWMNPTTREAEIKSQTAKAAKDAADKAAAGQRKKAAAVNMPKSDVSKRTTPTKGKSIEETMSNRLAALGYGQDD